MDNLETFLKGSDPTDTSTTDPVVTDPVVDPQHGAVSDPVDPAASADPATADRPRGPDGKFIPKGEPVDPAQAASPATTEPQLDHAALIGERRRRQEAEDRIRALEEQFAQFRQPAQPQATPQQDGPPDRWEDPEGYDQWLVGQAAQAARAEAMQAFQYQRIEMSANTYRAQVPDYDEKIQVFGQMVQTNPALLAQLNSAPNPAEYAYNTAKTQLEISQFGGIDGLVKARVEEALKAQVAPPASPSIPDTLADAQSARGSTAGGVHVPTLDEILKR